MKNNAGYGLGVSKVRWKGHGEILSDDYRLYYSRGERDERGEAISGA
jgi:hypothetical protein